MIMNELLGEIVAFGVTKDVFFTGMEFEGTCLLSVLCKLDHSRWIPDGQLCPTVPDRSNYIHWIEDLLASDVIPRNSDGDIVRGFDIGTGANCIYPLLGASILGWSFVGSDVTDVAVEWANWNVKNNRHISNLIEIRKVACNDSVYDESEREGGSIVVEESEPLPSTSSPLPADACEKYSGPPILLGVVRDSEKFDFCMCNPPCFENMEEAGLNPKTSRGVISDEMVCPGGTKAFIARIIDDNVVLRESFW